MNCCENCDSEKAQYTTKDSKFFFCNEQCQKTYFQKNLTQGCPFMFGLCQGRTEKIQYQRTQKPFEQLNETKQLETEIIQGPVVCLKKQTQQSQIHKDKQVYVESTKAYYSQEDLDNLTSETNNSINNDIKNHLKNIATIQVEENALLIKKTSVAALKVENNHDQQINIEEWNRIPVTEKTIESILMLQKRVMMQKFEKKQESNVQNKSIRSEILTWEQFNGPKTQLLDSVQLSTQLSNSYSTVYLKQSDFENGTLRIRAPCHLILQENIQFNPNRGLKKNWRVTREQKEDNRIYANESFVLDFFCAICIECSNVIIDLNRYRLEQHIEHALQQRFFAIIELADQPFIHQQGPAEFGDVIYSASRVFISNGTLGLSSHHGVHGNSPNFVQIEDVNFENFEVAGLALNQPYGLVVKNCHFKQTRKNSPVNAKYSASRFIQKLARLALAMAENFNNNNNTTSGTTSIDRLQTEKIKIIKTYLQQALAKLEQKIDETFLLIQQDKNDNIDEFYRNKSGILDGNAYGILIHSKGVAVKQFDQLEQKGIDGAEAVVLRNIKIQNIISDVNEVLALYNEKKKRQTVDVGKQLNTAAPQQRLAAAPHNFTNIYFYNLCDGTA